jgi:ubiquinone/menaquinone biosynthesis C-methylase UbiE
MSVDPRAESGFAGAEAYERGRPSYPLKVVEQLVRKLGGGTVMDLAAGTGKLTEALAAHASRVIAIEPSTAMLDVLRAKLPEVDARTGTAEAIPARDRDVDAVFVGEAFHWFDTAAAAQEIVRVLTPRGGLALLWTRARWSDEDLPWHPAFHELSIPYREAAGAFPAEQWREAFAQTGRFEPLRSHHVHLSDPDGFIALVASWSWIANLPARERAGFLTRVRELIGDQAELPLRYRTEMHWTRVE